MDDQLSSFHFFLSIAYAYAAVCGTWLLFRSQLKQWPEEPIPESSRKWLDLGMIVVAAFGVFLLGELYRRSLLLPDFEGALGYVSTAANLCIPFAPLMIILLFRRQSLDTVMLSGRALGYKLFVGTFAALLGLITYQLAIGRFAETPAVLTRSFSSHALAHAPAVFLEGVAVAFVYERLRWALGGVWSIWVPCLLFAAAHVPRSISSGRSPAEIMVWFAFNTVLPAMILLVIKRSRDVIWIAIPHYLLDVAIGAFD